MLFLWEQNILNVNLTNEIPRIVYVYTCSLSQNKLVTSTVVVSSVVPEHFHSTSTTRNTFHHC